MRQFLKGVFITLFTIILAAVVFLYNVQMRSPFEIGEFIELLGKKPTADNPEEYIQSVRQCMINYEPTVSVVYIGSAESMHSYVEDVLQDIFAVDDSATSSDFDYLAYNYAGMQVKMEGLFGYYKITYTFTYNETKEQTQEVDDKIQKLFKKWNIEKMNDYHKIKKIHDYVIRNATYDLSAKDNSAYSNLIDKTSACQGYASIMYKMLTEAGIPCRIIIGKGDNESHAWNIVRIKGSWYNLDATWDDPVGPVGEEYISYAYFLKGNKNFTDHTPDAKFLTEAFQTEYKISEMDYRP